MPYNVEYKNSNPFRSTSLSIYTKTYASYKL